MHQDLVMVTLRINGAGAKDTETLESSLLPRLKLFGLKHGLGKLNRLKDDTGPQEHLVRAIALFGLNSRPESLGFLGIPNFKEAFLS